MLPKEMHTVCLLGSPRRNGNSDVLALQFMQQVSLSGATSETFALSDLNYSGCKNLFHCKQGADRCGQTDDLSQVLEAILKAQVLVLATPVYFTSVSGQLKLAIDRFFSFFVPDYPTVENKSRLSSGRHLVFLQTQGEPEDKYAGLMESFSASFLGLGFDHQHLVRACGVRNLDDVCHLSSVLQDCDDIAKHIYV